MPRAGLAEATRELLSREDPPDPGVNARRSLGLCQVPGTPVLDRVRRRPRRGRDRASLCCLCSGIGPTTRCASEFGSVQIEVGGVADHADDKHLLRGFRYSSALPSAEMRQVRTWSVADRKRRAHNSVPGRTMADRPRQHRPH